MNADYATIGQDEYGAWTYSEYTEEGEWIGTRFVDSYEDGEAIAAALAVPVNPQP